jgi:hypothetical protein
MAYECFVIQRLCVVLPRGVIAAVRFHIWVMRTKNIGVYVTARLAIDSQHREKVVTVANDNGVSSSSSSLAHVDAFTAGSALVVGYFASCGDIALAIAAYKPVRARALFGAGPCRLPWRWKGAPYGASCGGSAAALARAARAHVARAHVLMIFPGRRREAVENCSDLPRADAAGRVPWRSLCVEGNRVSFVA